MATRNSGRTTTGNVTELPDAPPDATGLTTRQQRILATLRDSIEQRGYPPSICEIGETVGLASSSSVAHQLRALEAKGFIKRDPNRPRALEVFIPELMAARRALVLYVRFRRTGAAAWDKTAHVFPHELPAE